MIPLKVRQKTAVPNWLLLLFKQVKLLVYITFTNNRAAGLVHCVLFYACKSYFW